MVGLFQDVKTNMPDWQRYLRPRIAFSAAHQSNIMGHYLGYYYYYYLQRSVGEAWGPADLRDRATALTAPHPWE